MEETIIAWVLSLLTAFWAGFSFGKKNTTISPHYNYSGPIEKLIVNGTVSPAPSPKEETQNFCQHDNKQE